MSAENLYKELILDHSKSPRNFGELSGATNQAEGFNPLCGDHYFVDLILDEDNIQDIYFHGEGCALSKASASIMTEQIKGKTKQEALELLELFQNLITGNLDSTNNDYLDVFSGVKEYPMRGKCATLPWHTLKESLSFPPRI